MATCNRLDTASFPFSPKSSISSCNATSILSNFSYLIILSLLLVSKSGLSIFYSFSFLFSFSNDLRRIFPLSRRVLFGPCTHDVLKMGDVDLLHFSVAYVELWWELCRICTYAWKCRTWCITGSKFIWRLSITYNKYKRSYTIPVLFVTFLEI